MVHLSLVHGRELLIEQRFDNLVHELVAMRVDTFHRRQVMYQCAVGLLLVGVRIGTCCRMLWDASNSLSLVGHGGRSSHTIQRRSRVRPMATRWIARRTANHNVMRSGNITLVPVLSRVLLHHEHLMPVLSQHTARVIRPRPRPLHRLRRRLRAVAVRSQLVASLVIRKAGTIETGIQHISSHHVSAARSPPVGR